MTAKKSASDPNFESSLERLEHIVRQLEAGDLALEQSLEHYEEGMKLVQSCRKMLDTAEQRIAILTENQQGAPEVGPAADEDGEIRPQPQLGEF